MQPQKSRLAVTVIRKGTLFKVPCQFGGVCERALVYSKGPRHDETASRVRRCLSALRDRTEHLTEAPPEFLKDTCNLCTPSRGASTAAIVAHTNPAQRVRCAGSRMVSLIAFDCPQQEHTKGCHLRDPYLVVTVKQYVTVKLPNADLCEALATLQVGDCYIKALSLLWHEPRIWSSSARIRAKA